MNSRFMEIKEEQIEIGLELKCYRVFDCDFLPDKYEFLSNKKGTHRMEIGRTYRIIGCGSLFMRYGVINPYTNEEYKGHGTEGGFSIEVTEYQTEETIVGETKLIYFSTDPESDIYYGKWFFPDVDYREWKIKYLLNEQEK